MKQHNEARIQLIYENLSQTERTHQAIPSITEAYPDLTVEEAYQIQIVGIEKKLESGHGIVGKKIGLTSVAMQELLGVNQPDYGHLLDNMKVSNRGSVRLNELFQPKIEAEIAFILKKDLEGPNITIEDVIDATDYIVPALEIVDSRIMDWKIKLADTIADNASSGLFVLGDHKFSIDTVDLPLVEMELFRNGELMNTGVGSAVLGNPSTCVAWLASALSKYEVKLKAGEVILSGALSAAIPAGKGDQFTAKFKGLGDVEISFF
ncbi:2-keto-4-pentenoate hydratase [Peribacillus simplex]|uniref:2-keto-4-pentenoate hydratase n=1 Tax=Peribacillus simplex TaxID=1478 RepID=UPI0037FBED2D